MAKLSILVSIAVAIILLNTSIDSSTSDSQEVKYVVRNTTMGSVRGTTEKVLGINVDIFLGIPFGKPPVGELRFKRPEPFPKWDDVRNATQLPASCYQKIGVSARDGSRRPNTERSEDCLYLNVWQPFSLASLVSSKLASSVPYNRRPVMVWIYGGGFTTGTSTFGLYDARILAAKGDVVVVSMQYRLGPLGFLYTGTDEAPGNQGLLDQQLALQWVHENIDSFGGDPNRVTLFGESAGGFSVSVHLLSPLSRDLVQSGIMQSGTALSHWGLDAPAKAKQKAVELAKDRKCHGGGHDDEMVKCLRGIDADDLVNDLRGSFLPTVDDYFLKEPPIETLKRGNLTKHSILLGANRDEGFLFLARWYPRHFDRNASSVITTEDYQEIVSDILRSFDIKGSLATQSIAFEYGAPYFLNQSARYRKVLDDVIGDVFFKCPTVDLAVHYALKSGADVYVYDFNHRTSASPFPSWMGVMHAFEIDHVFGMPINASLNYTQNETRLSAEMVRYWTNFAKTGNPNKNGDGRDAPDGIVWQTYRPSDRKVLLLESDQIKLQIGLRERQCDYWRHIVPTLRAFDALGGTSSSGRTNLAAFLFMTSSAVLWLWA